MRSAPPPPKKDISLNGEQFDRLANCAGGVWTVLIYTMACAGLRWGEVSGLHRSGCALLRRRLHVVEAVSKVDGFLHFAEPKSVTSARWVRIPAFLAEMLGEHLSNPIDQGDDPLVFAVADGGPLRYCNIRRRVWEPAVAATPGRPEGLTIHHLRHTTAALMIRRARTWSWCGINSATLRLRSPSGTPTCTRGLRRRWQHASTGPSAKARVGLLLGREPLERRRRRLEMPEPLAGQGVPVVVRAGIGPATSGFSDRRSPN